MQVPNTSGMPVPNTPGMPVPSTPGMPNGGAPKQEVPNGDANQGMPVPNGSAKQNVLMNVCAESQCNQNKKTVSFNDSIKQINQIFQGETGIYGIFEVYRGVLEYANYMFPDVCSFHKV